MNNTYLDKVEMIFQYLHEDLKTLFGDTTSLHNRVQDAKGKLLEVTAEHFPLEGWDGREVAEQQEIGN